MKRFNGILLLMAFLVTCKIVCAETYPEFTGNYYHCSSGWCEFKHHQLNTMLLCINEKGGSVNVGYGGFFEIPESAPTVKSNKPRFLFYMGRDNVDPRFTALVELAPMPYNNAQIFTMDGTDYKSNVKYAKRTTKQMWTFKREIPVRFKQIEGKVGMFVIESSDDLPDGFYAIDYGTPKASGHSELRTAPEPMGLYKTMNVQTAIPFIIGDRSKIALRASNVSKSKKNKTEGSSDAKAEDSSADDESQHPAKKTINNFINGLFKKHEQ